MGNGKARTQKALLEALYNQVVEKEKSGLMERVDKKIDDIFVKIDALTAKFNDFLVRREDTCPLNKRKLGMVPARALVFSGLGATAATVTLITKLLGWW